MIDKEEENWRGQSQKFSQDCRLLVSSFPTIRDIIRYNIGCNGLILENNDL